MIQHTQRWLNKPEDPVPGDCFRTAIACVMNFEDPEEVPHFVDADNWWGDAHEWLHEQGWQIIWYPARADSVDEVAREFGSINPNLLWMLCGRSPRGFDHVVIYRGNTLEWDPHPEGGGIVGPLTDSENRYDIYVLTPVIP